ncbi:unnamed protein product [Caenorhabditis nigoni]
MDENNEEVGKDPKFDSQSGNSEILEKLSSLEQKVDKMTEELQSIGESMAKIPKTDDDEKKTMMKFEKQLESLKKSILSNNQNKKELKSEKKFVLKHVFENVTEFEENKHNYSEYEDHYNVRWRVNLVRFTEHLGFFIRCEPIAPAGKWSIQTKLEYKVAGKNQKVIRTEDYCYEKILGWGFDEFLDWDEMKNEYLIDDNLTVEVEVEIIKMTGFEKQKIREFDESQNDVSDVIVVVQDTKFFVSKTYLAAQSAFFKTLFLGNFSESSKSEVALSGIDPNDFQCFLEVLYGESAINDSAVEGILQVADMYATPMVVRKCEEFLLEKSKKSAKKLLEMVARYNLENLKKKCMSEIKTVADIRAVLPSNTKDLDPLITAELLDKSLSLH